MKNSFVFAYFVISGFKEKVDANYGSAARGIKKPIFGLLLLTGESFWSPPNKRTWPCKWR